MNEGSSRPTFYTICKMQQGFTNAILVDIAREACVEIHVINALFLDEPINQKEAECILEVLSRRTGQVFTLTTVAVRLIPSKEALDEGD